MLFYEFWTFFMKYKYTSSTNAIIEYSYFVNQPLAIIRIQKTILEGEGIAENISPYYFKFFPYLFVGFTLLFLNRQKNKKTKDNATSR